MASLAESFRSVLLRIEALGLFRGEAIDVEALAEELRAEARCADELFPGAADGVVLCMEAVWNRSVSHLR
jgi:hypothetical protein